MPKARRDMSEEDFCRNARQTALPLWRFLLKERGVSVQHAGRRESDFRRDLSAESAVCKVLSL